MTYLRKCANNEKQKTLSCIKKCIIIAVLTRAKRLFCNSPLSTVTVFIFTFKMIWETQHICITILNRVPRLLIVRKNNVGISWMHCEQIVTNTLPLFQFNNFANVWPIKISVSPCKLCFVKAGLTVVVLTHTFWYKY